MQYRIIIFILISFLGCKSIAQELEPLPEKKVKSNKGKMYVYWGWNNDYYTNSNIHFKGSDYDFIIKNAAARDRQTAFGFNPYFTEVSIPQYNFRIGYYFNKHYELSLAVDHMKYVMINDRSTKMDGYINNGSQFDGVYNDGTTTLPRSFLTFEHTDGLNYINSEINRSDELLPILGINSKIFSIKSTIGAGGGILLPKTNAKLMGNRRHDDFHISGFGLAANAGLRFTFWDHLFIQSVTKVGFIDMPDIRTTFSGTDKASQDFFFLQFNYVFGFIFQLSK